MILLICLIVVFGLTGLFTFALLRTASIADRQAEEYYAQMSAENAGHEEKEESA